MNSGGRRAIRGQQRMDNRESRGEVEGAMRETTSQRGATLLSDKLLGYRNGFTASEDSLTSNIK